MFFVIVAISTVLSLVSGQAGCATRQSWSSMSAGGKQIFKAALVRMKASGQYDKFPCFLPWHRAFINDFEKSLGVPLPFWDWSSDAQTPHLSDIFSPDYFGSSGDDAGGNCIVDGIAATWTSMGGGCVKRCFDGGDTINSYTPAEVLWAGISRAQDYKGFQRYVEGSCHAQIHNSLGIRCSGDMANMYSPHDPIFFLHHSNIDRLWSRWQSSCKTFEDSYDGSADEKLPGMSYTVKDTLFTGKMCHQYAPARSDVAVKWNCPEPVNTLLPPTATESDSAPTPTADPLNADGSWLYNDFKLLVPAAAGLAKRDIVANETVFANETVVANETVEGALTGNGTVNGTIGEGNSTIANNTIFLNGKEVRVNLEAYKNIFENSLYEKFVDNDSNDTVVYVPGADIKVKAPSYTSKDPKLCRQSVPISETYLKKMNLNVKKVRKIEAYNKAMTDKLNQEIAAGRINSKSSLDAQAQKLLSQGYSLAYIAKHIQKSQVAKNYELTKAASEEKPKGDSKGEYGIAEGVEPVVVKHKCNPYAASQR